MAPFSTFFGDYLHGLWIKWETAEVGGAAGFQVTFQANYRARMYTWGNTGATVPDTLDSSRDYDYTGIAGNTAWTDKKSFWFYLVWSNPNST